MLASAEVAEVDSDRTENINEVSDVTASRRTAVHHTNGNQEMLFVGSNEY